LTRSLLASVARVLSERGVSFAERKGRQRVGRCYYRSGKQQRLLLSAAVLAACASTYSYSGSARPFPLNLRHLLGLTELPPPAARHPFETRHACACNFDPTSRAAVAVHVVIVVVTRSSMAGQQRSSTRMVVGLGGGSIAANRIAMPSQADSSLSPPMHINRAQ